MDPVKLIMMIVGLIYGALLFVKPRLTTAILVFLCIVHFNWFARYMGGGPYLSRLPYFVAALLSMNLLMDLFTNKLRISGTHRILLLALQFVILLTAVAIASNAYNGESYVLGIYELRFFFLTAVLALALFYYNLLHPDIHSFAKLAVCLGLIQIPPALFQYFLAGGGAERTLDSVSGTFGGYGTLVFLQTFAIGTALVYRQSTGKNTINLNTYALCALLCIPILFSNSRSAFGFILIMIGYVYFTSVLKTKNPALVLKNSIAVVLLASVAAGVFYEYFWKARGVADQLSIAYGIDYYFRDPVTSREIYLRGADPVMGRGRSVVEASRLITGSLPELFLGRGSGSTSEASFLGAEGNFYQKYGPLAGVGRTQYSKVIAEFGIAGAALFLWFFSALWRKAKTIAQPDQQTVAEIYKVFLVAIVILSIYSQIFESNFVSLLMAYLLVVLQFYTKEQRKAAE